MDLARSVSLCAVARRPIDALVALEDALEIVRRYAATLIAHRDEGRVAVLPHGYVDRRTLAPVFDRIVHEIADQLRQLQFVAHDDRAFAASKFEIDRPG